MTPIVPSVATFPSLGALLDDALVRHRSRTLLVEVERKREASRWTGGEIDAAASRQAARLQSLGVRSGDRVALFLSNSPRWLVTAIAVFRCGAVLVPLDPKLEPAEQVALLAHARPSVLVIDHAIWVRHTTVPVPHVIVSEAPEGADLRGGIRWEDAPDGEPRVASRSPSDLACIVYLSLIHI